MGKEKIKINQDERKYEIESIMPVSQHVIRIMFSDSVPETFGDIIVYTVGGVRCSELPGYSTVYRDDGKKVYLSDDGSVYVPPEEVPEDPGDMQPYVPTLEELQGYKRYEVSGACEKVIYEGVSVTLTDGSTEHFALTEHDQINLFGKQAQLAAGTEQLEYHADGQPCRYFSAEDMRAIIEAAMFHVSYHTTYCNSLNMWITDCQDAEELQAVFYGADIPEEYQSEVLKAYLKQIEDMAEVKDEDAI